MFTIPVKMKIEDEFFNFIRKFQKIGEIEEGTILMGVKCLDSEGCLSRIKLFLITDEKEADAVLFHDKTNTYYSLKSYERFKSDLKEEKEKLREELERKVLMNKLHLNELSDDDYWKCMLDEDERLTSDEASQIYNTINEKLQTTEMQDEVFKRVTEKLAKEIAQYFVTQVVLNDDYCSIGKLVSITGTDPFNPFIRAIPAEDGILKREGNKKIVTDGIYMFVWERDNLLVKIYEYDMKNDKRMTGGIREEVFNGFAQYVLHEPDLLEKFCNENNVELVQVPEWSVDRHEKLEKLLQAAGIK
ncbi:MAG: hypothetical protein U0H95_12470 [Lachnospira sp.]|nr:hypothetical protein [Lachnospira sp.]